MATRGRVFNPPPTVAQATEFIEGVTATPCFGDVQPGSEFLQRLLATAREAEIRAASWCSMPKLPLSTGNTALTGFPFPRTAPSGFPRSGVMPFWRRAFPVQLRPCIRSFQSKARTGLSLRHRVGAGKRFCLQSLASSASLLQKNCSRQRFFRQRRTAEGIARQLHRGDPKEAKVHGHRFGWRPMASCRERIGTQGRNDRGRNSPGRPEMSPAQKFCNHHNPKDMTTRRDLTDHPKPVARPVRLIMATANQVSSVSAK